jgi:hypothetical protein
MAHCIIAGGGEHEFYSDGRVQTNPIMLLQKQETKITGEWV